MNKETNVQIHNRKTDHLYHKYILRYMAYMYSYIIQINTSGVESRSIVKMKHEVRCKCKYMTYGYI